MLGSYGANFGKIEQKRKSQNLSKSTANKELLDRVHLYHDLHSTETLRKIINACSEDPPDQMEP